MPRYRTAYPPEFRRQMVDLVRSGRTPEELAREFEPTAQSICTWVKQAERDAGKRIAGPTSAEREELGRLRRENHRLRQERDILAKAAAWFAREKQGEPERVYRFMSAHQAIYPIRTMASVLKVSASGYYAWRSRPVKVPKHPRRLARVRQRLEPRLVQRVGDAPLQPRIAGETENVIDLVGLAPRHQGRARSRNRRSTIFTRGQRSRI